MSGTDESDAITTAADDVVAVHAAPAAAAAAAKDDDDYAHDGGIPYDHTTPHTYKEE